MCPSFQTPETAFGEITLRFTQGDIQPADWNPANFE